MEVFSVRIRTVTGLILGLALLLSASPAAAQDPMSVGVKAGLNLANLSFEGDDDEPDNRSGFVVGVLFSRPLRSRVDLQVEALYSQKGAKITDSEFDFEERIRLGYIEIPVLANFLVASTDRASVHVLAGPTFGFLVNSESVEEFDGEEFEDPDFDDAVKSFDAGFAIGAAVKTGQLVFDLRYTFGLTNIAENEDDEDDDFSVKNRALTFSVAWMFR